MVPPTHRAVLGQEYPSTERQAPFHPLGLIQLRCHASWHLNFSHIAFVYRSLPSPSHLMQVTRHEDDEDDEDDRRRQPHYQPPRRKLSNRRFATDFDSAETLVFTYSFGSIP